MKRVVWCQCIIVLSYRASDVGKTMVKGQEGLSLSCVLHFICFPREGVLLSVHGSVWCWKCQCTPAVSWRGCACCQHPAAAWQSWQSPAQLPEGVRESVGKCQSPNYGVSAACGLACEEPCAPVGLVRSWQDWGAWRVGTHCQGKASRLGGPPRTCVCVWNSQ